MRRLGQEWEDYEDQNKQSCQFPPFYENIHLLSTMQ